MGYSIPAGFAFDPQLASAYGSAAFVENIDLLDRALGVVKTLDTGGFEGSLGGGGQFIELPHFRPIAGLIARRDLDALGAPADLDVTGETARAVILRRRAGPVKFTEDLFVKGLRRESVEQEVGRQIGQLAAREVRERLLQAAVTGLQSADTPVADVHIKDVHVVSGVKQKLTLPVLYETRMKLGDAYNRLNTVVCHSETFHDLVNDTLGNYKIENVGGFTVVTGLPQVFGMRLVVVDDPALKTVAEGEFAKYRTLLLGADALGVMYHQRLRIEAERRLDYEAPYWRVLANFDFAPHVFGLKWTGSGGNPDNAALGDTANWGAAYADHREVLAAMCVHNATAA